MDLKASTNLDPKLKEAYERVMGTSFTPLPPPVAKTEPLQQAQTPQQPVAATIPLNTEPPLQPPPVQPLHVTTVEEPQPAQPLPPTPQPQENATPQAPEMVQSPQTFASVNPFQSNPVPPGEVLVNNAVVPQKKSSMLIIVGLLVGGIIFFVVYAFIWAKVFGLF